MVCSFLPIKFDAKTFVILKCVLRLPFSQEALEFSILYKWICDENFWVIELWFRNDSCFCCDGKTSKKQHMNKNWSTKIFKNVPRSTQGRIFCYFVGRFKCLKRLPFSFLYIVVEDVNLFKTKLVYNFFLRKDNAVCQSCRGLWFLDCP